MPILLDEDLPRRPAGLLPGHAVSTVAQEGWAGTKNGELLKRAGARSDVLMTMDRNLAFQQSLARLPVSVLVVVARGNRLPDIAPVAPRILAELEDLPARSLRKVVA